MSLTLFWFFALVMLIGGLAVICFRNPVSSALSMVVSFVGLAALFIGLDAYFVGIIQILVYTGAIMVLFLFIIMLLDLKTESRRSPRYAAVAGGLGIVLALTIQVLGVLGHTPDQTSQPLDLAAASASFEEVSPGIAEKLAAGHLPDVNIIGQVLFERHNLPLQIVGILLLAATIGVVVLSKRQPV